MTSAQASERNIDQSNKQINVQISEETTAQLIKLLIAIILNYDDAFWNADTELFGAIAEFDSMALVTLIGEIEEYFDITLDEDDISAENFASVTSLTELVLASSEHS